MTAEYRIISVHVYPKSSCEKVEGEVTDAAGNIWLKIRLTTAPEGGKANKALLALLASHWGCARSDLEIISGETSRYKRVKRRI
jgi:uncharacterized protein YggU (UPF0235/DUF167 family)